MGSTWKKAETSTTSKVVEVEDNGRSDAFGHSARGKLSHTLPLSGAPKKGIVTPQRLTNNQRSIRTKRNNGATDMSVPASSGVPRLGM